MKRLLLTIRYRLASGWPRCRFCQRWFGAHDCLVLHADAVYAGGMVRGTDNREAFRAAFISAHSTASTGEGPA